MSSTLPLLLFLLLSLRLECIHGVHRIGRVHGTFDRRINATLRLLKGFFGVGDEASPLRRSRQTAPGNNCKPKRGEG